MSKVQDVFYKSLPDRSVHRQPLKSIFPATHFNGLSLLALNLSSQGGMASPPFQLDIPTQNINPPDL